MELFKRFDTYTIYGESVTGRFKFNPTPFTNLIYEFIYFNNVIVSIYNNGLINSLPIILKCDELGSDFSIVISDSGRTGNPVMYHWNKPTPIELNFNLFNVDINGVLVPLQTGTNSVLYAFTIQFIKC